MSPQSFQNIVEASGLPTHLKAVKHLRDNDWFVKIGSYYFDSVADSVREIDIVAEKQFNSGFPANHSSVQVNIQLFMECKFLPQEVIFWFDEVNRGKAIEKLEKNTTLDIAERKSGDVSPAKFHYLTIPNAGKLFSSNSNKEDIIYKAVSQSLRAQVYYEQWSNEPIACKFHGNVKNTKIIRYPTIVFENFSNAKEVVVGEDFKTYKAKGTDSPFLIETNYVYPTKDKLRTIDDYFLIDVVDIESLPAYLTLISTEARSVVEALSFKV